MIRDLLDLVNRDKRKRERVYAVQKFVVGIGTAAAVGVAAGILFAPKSGKETREDIKKKAVNTVETIKDTVQKKAETVKDSAVHAAKEVCNVINEVHLKSEDINKDIHQTAENILDEFKK